jgi:transcription elongation factor GreA
MAGIKKIYVTEEGRAKLEEELQHLYEVRRPEVASRIQAAKEEGDISENAGYEEAKREQAFLEGRVLTIEGMLKNVEIIQNEGPSDKVRLGTRVTVVEDGGSEKEVYQIVGSVEADVASGYISNESPLGQSLMGRSVGDSVSVEAPSGTLSFTIVALE